MNAPALLDSLQSRGVQVMPDGNQLLLDAPPGVLTPKVLSAFSNGTTAKVWENKCKEAGIPSRTFYDVREALVHSRRVNSTATRPRERGAIYTIAELSKPDEDENE